MNVHTTAHKKIGDILPASAWQIVRSARLWWSVAIVVWLVASVAGLAALLRYAGGAGTPADSQRHWPTDSALVANREGGTLLMFIHPQCPCTRASLGELEKVVARCHDALTTYVVVVGPTDADDSWSHGELWSAASAIPFVNLFDDRGGEEARRFGVSTSGQALLYDQRGQLQFSGGITSARGHAGDNVGRTSIEHWVRQLPTVARQTPVFGCPLAAPQNGK
jgi:hypothetical protein